MENKVYLMMNKPAGYVCSAVSDSHKTVYQLLPVEMQELLKAKRGQRLHTVGRLDCDTCGLLLFTTDGEFSNYLTRPESHVEKTYEAVLEKPVTKGTEQTELIKKFAGTMTLPAEKKAPEQQVQGAELSFISETKAVLTIKQGKFHQVRRMFLAVENKVTALKRISMGKYCLPETLAPGQWTYFIPEESFAKKEI